MKVLGICGSHRKDSTAMFFLGKAIDAAGKEGAGTEIITLHDRQIGHCTVCGLCAKKFACSISDGMQEIYEKMSAADAIILASPVYYAMVSGRMKSMMDRTLPLRRNGMKLSGKVIGAIAVGASRNGGQEMVCDQILRFGGLHEMIAVTDGGTAHFGGTCWVPRGSRPEDDKFGIETCENLGRKVAETLKRMK